MSLILRLHQRLDVQPPGLHDGGRRRVPRPTLRPHGERVQGGADLQRGPGGVRTRTRCRFGTRRRGRWPASPPPSPSPSTHHRHEQQGRRHGLLPRRLPVGAAAQLLPRLSHGASSPAARVRSPTCTASAYVVLLEIAAVRPPAVLSAHPDPSLRPSIRQAVSMQCEVTLPTLPDKMPTPKYT